MSFGFDTRQIHAGAVVDSQTGARITPVYQTAGYVFESFDDAAERFGQRANRPIYSRAGNPTNRIVEARLADLEGGIGALLTSSGQAAIATVLLALAPAGSRVLATSSLYEGTKHLFRDSIERTGVEFVFLDAEADDASWEAAFTEATTLVYTESIPNPKNDVPDLERLATIAHRHGVPLVVDSTVATPYLLRPIEFGADIVIHSTSKWLSGHGNVIGGAIIDGGHFDWAASGRFPQLTTPLPPTGLSFVDRFGAGALLPYLSGVIGDYGPTFPAASAQLLLLGIETLSLRVARHVESTQTIAEWLDAHEAVGAVDYPGLPSNPSYERAQRYLPLGAGGVLAFEVRGGRAAAERFINALQLVTRMTHIGDVRTLALHTGSTIHGRLSEEERLAIGITPGLVRLSVGLETVQDILDDLAQALAASQA
ncbi:O-acetylhomoserine aminocarboxypropyltransferase/cysteine synthase family protein [Humidisolicoccus flavus]|uniref:O-acetylhomoserine aminocarboxypropyltransferase/cysteine synthase family protein n=1 Tax=Humidisolicoccus flavus TaxID=3111414 RepID=UPI00324B4C71